MSYFGQHRPNKTSTSPDSNSFVKVSTLPDVSRKPGIAGKINFWFSIQYFSRKCNKTFVGKKLKTKTKYFTLKFEILLFINILELTI